MSCYFYCRLTHYMKNRRRKKEIKKEKRRNYFKYEKEYIVGFILVDKTLWMYFPPSDTKAFMQYFRL